MLKESYEVIIKFTSYDFFIVIYSLLKKADVSKGKFKINHALHKYEIYKQII